VLPEQAEAAAALRDRELAIVDVLGGADALCPLAPGKCAGPELKFFVIAIK
jgi:hypothetical protein